MKTIPVTVKIRAGWDDTSKNAAELAKRLEDAGAALICVHARTREQMYNPGIDIGIIADVKKAVNIPVIGNGDKVISQTPNPLDPFINLSGRIIIYTDEDEQKYSYVPSLIGMKIDEANKAVIESGLNIRIVGISNDGLATVVSQSIAAGSVVPLGSIIELEIIYLDFED